MDGMSLKRRIKTLVPLVIVVSYLLYSHSGLCDGEVTSGFEALYQQALKTNPDIQQIRATLNVSQQDIVIAGYIPNPSAQMVWNFGNITTQLGNPQQFGVQQLVELGGKRNLRTLKAKAGFEGTELAIKQLTWALHSNLRLAYLDYLTELSQRDQLQQQAALFDELVRIAEARVKAGAAPEAESLQVKLSRHQLDPQVIEANGQLQQAKLKLNQWLGLTTLSTLPDLTQQITLLEQVPYWPNCPKDGDTNNAVLQQLISLGRAHRQELNIAQNQLKQTYLTLRAAKAAQIPDPTLGTGTNFARATNPVATVLSDKGFFWGIYASLGVPLPIFHNQQGEIAKSKAQITVDQLAIRSTEFQIDSHLQQAVQSIITRQQALETFRNELIPESYEVLKLANLGYRYGKTGLANVILARQSYQAVQNDYLNTLSEDWQAWATLEQEVGLPLEELFPELGWNHPIKPYERPKFSAGMPTLGDGKH